MQPSSPSMPYQMPQSGPVPMQPNPVPVNYTAPVASPSPQPVYSYPQNVPVQYVQAAQPAGGTTPQSNGGHGEKVIQPIHDINAEQRQTEIQRQMAELLGETVEPASDQSTASQGYTQGSTPTAVQTSSAPQTMPYTPLPHITAPTYAQNQQGAYPPQVYYQQTDPQVAAAMQLRALQAEEMRRAQYAQAAAAQQMAAQRAQAQYQQQMLNYSRISPADAQKVASSIITPPIPTLPTPTTATPSVAQAVQFQEQNNPNALNIQRNNG